MRLAALAAALVFATFVSPGAKAGDPGPQAFSSLTQVDRSTIDRLQLFSQTSLGSPSGQAGAIALAGDLVVAQTPFPHAVVALRLDGQGTQAWRFEPAPDAMARGLACCSPGRQPTAVGDKVVLETLDGHVIALDGRTGAVAWDRVVADPRQGEILTGEPVAAGNRILVGNAGDDNGARGWIAALDSGDGHEIWRTFSTGPDREVGIADAFRPFLERDRGTDLGVATWPPGGSERGGGTVPGSILVDEDAGLVIHGTGRPAPGDPGQRPGDNLWTSGLMARSLADGSARWFVGLNRNDPYGYGGAGPLMLADRDWQGKPRKLVLHANRNGVFFVVDRSTGEVLAADPYVDVTVHDGYDVFTGAMRWRADKIPRQNRVARGICPSSPPSLQGGGAYSPQTGLAYLGVDRTCMDLEVRRTGAIAGTPYLGTNLRLKQPPEGPRGELVAWDVAARRRAWSVPEDFPVAGGVLATAGGLVFYATLDGSLKALDAATGRLMWTRFLPGGSVAQPVALKAPDGGEVIAVLSGLPGPLAVPSDADIDVRDATAASGAGHGLPDLPQRTGRGAFLSLFRIR